MQAVAIRKKAQQHGKKKQKPKPPALKKPESKGVPAVELMRELVRLVRVEGMGYAKAYRRVFPHRQQALQTASTQGRLLVERYMREHAEDLREMLVLHGLGEDRFAKELDRRYKAKTLREVVRSEVIRPRGSKGKPAKQPFVLTMRETIEVEDNTTRMRATELHADVLGARKTAGDGGIQQNVAVIYVVGGKIKKKRQERIVSP